MKTLRTLKTELLADTDTRAEYDAMASEFRRADPYKLKDNVFKLIDLDWMLVTAGTPER